MNIRDLEYLVAVHQHKHFGKAAEACFVSQPTLSGQLKKLQEELDIELIEKSNRKVIFTEAGEIIVSQARQVLDATQELYRTAQNLKDPLAGKLVVGAIPTVGPYFYPLVLRVWREKFPRVEFILKELKTEEIIEQLLKAEIDLGILALPLKVSQLSEIVIYEEAFCVAMSTQEPGAPKKRVSPAWLQNKDLMLLSEGHCFRDQALQYCSLTPTQTQANFTATSLETLRSMVSLGEGVTLVPELTALQWGEGQAQDGIRYVDFEGSTPVRQVGFIYRKGTRQEQLFESLSMEAKKSIQKKIKRRRNKSVIDLRKL